MGKLHSGTFEITAKMIRIGKNHFVRIEKVIIKVPYNQELKNKVKTISGRIWKPQRKYREIPYNEDLMPKLQSIFGGNLAIDITFILARWKQKFTLMSTQKIYLQ